MVQANYPDESQHWWPLCPRYSILRFIFLVVGQNRTAFVGLHGDGLGKRSGSFAVERLQHDRVRRVRRQTVDDQVFAVLRIYVYRFHHVTILWRSRRQLHVVHRQISDMISDQNSVASLRRRRLPHDQKFRFALGFGAHVLRRHIGHCKKSRLCIVDKTLEPIYERKFRRQQKKKKKNRTKQTIFKINGFFSLNPESFGGLSGFESNSTISANSSIEYVSSASRFPNPAIGTVEWKRYGSYETKTINCREKSVVTVQFRFVPFVRVYSSRREFDRFVLNRRITGRNSDETDNCRGRR